MTRRKSGSLKWTLILLIVVFCPHVHTRPQDTSTISVRTDLTTDKLIRYRNGNTSLRYSSPKLPIVISPTEYDNLMSDNNIELVKQNKSKIYNTLNQNKDEPSNANSDLKDSNRISRLIKNIVIKDMSKHKNNHNEKIKPSPKPTNKIRLPQINHDIRKSPIRKVLTKWKDKTKYEDLNFTYETATSDETDPTTFDNLNNPNEYTSTESTKDEPIAKKRHPSKYYTAMYKPQNDYSEETHVYSTNVQIVDKYPPQSTYMYTKRPSPTPEITNVGYPKPWLPQNHYVYKKPTTQKPVHVTRPLNYNYHNSRPNYANDYEVTTFPPASGYTEKIIIRPNEYSVSNDECPTIFLTLNNTFQGQAKEACPDLNIAVNTNVVNKNNVIESEEDEDDSDSLFPNGFGIPLGDDSAPEDFAANDYFESNENQGQEESASVEGTELSNYNAANALQSESAEPGSSFSQSSPILGLSKPGRPNKDDDELFGFSSLVQFFRPAITALGWLTSINPFAIGLFPIFLAPIAFLFAGSGLAALFSPWFLSPLGREAPPVVHVSRPHWHWDDTIKTWHLHSFPDNRRWRPSSRSSKKEEKEKSSVTPTLFRKLKDWMIRTTINLRDRNKDNTILSTHKRVDRKNKRKKREIWSIRVKYVSSASQNAEEFKPSDETKTLAASTATPESSRDVKTKVPIGESIKLVANQLLDKPNVTGENTVVIDTRIPPKVKSQVKHKIKVRNENGEEPLENAHAGEAVPVTMEELETENSVPENESTTSNEGISTWVLVSSPINKENASVSTEPTKTDGTKKPKPSAPKNKNKKPQNNKASAKRPVIGSTNKSDLIAGGSAINDNVYNKIKDTVLSNVQKNKNPSTQRPAKVTSTTIAPLIEETTKKEVNKAQDKPIASTATKGTTKTKKKNKNKHKVSTTTTEEPSILDSALLFPEAKEQEIELEVSTPPVTTKKPKRSSTKKKNKTKKRKTTKPKPDSETSISEIKTSSNKTKSTKGNKKPQAVQGAITSQLYNYFSREVMPSVGVGVLGLASIVGIASYFFYPFSTPVRRTFEVDKRDDLYKNNAEDYANDGNGQAEEDMLGTVLAGMPTHAKNKLNPYAGQTAYINRYPVKKEQDLRYRNVATKYEPSYNARYPQQKTGIAHGAVYSKPVNYSPHYETRHAYTTEGKFNFEKLPTSYAPYPAIEPIYAAPQTGPSGSSGISSYGNDNSNSVVYGVKPSSETDFKPVYPFEGQFYSETTYSPVTYAPTSLYLGSNNAAEQSEEQYIETSSASNEIDESKFVVGNVPKELSESATPAIVPEHGPRKLNRKKRSSLGKRSISSSLEEILRMEKENKDIFISNEIDDSIVVPLRKLAPITETVTIVEEIPTPTKPEEVFTVYASSVDPTIIAEESTTIKNGVIESISTIPIINDERKVTTTDGEISNDAEVTTKTFKVYEVFSSPDVTSSPIVKDLTAKVETTTQFRNMMTETTTEQKSETTSTMPPSPSPFSEPKDPLPSTTGPTPIVPDVVTYPPLNETSSIFSFLKRMLEFKVKLGMSIVQNVGDSMDKFLKSFDTKATAQRFAKASQNI